MILGIIGLGVVGTALYEAFRLQTPHSVLTYDIKDEPSLINFTQCDIIFICVPTAQLPNGSCDTSIVEEVAQSLSDIQFKGLIAIKSTVTPGTTEKLIHRFNDMRICCTPEFLRQNTAYKDFISSNTLVAGVQNDSDFEILALAHAEFVKKFKRVSPTEAELAKYFCNNFNSIRVVFANIFYEMSKKLNANYQNVLDAAREGPLYQFGDYLDCNENLRGFDGACLPKDINAFAALLDDLNFPYELIRSAINDNNYFTK